MSSSRHPQQPAARPRVGAPGAPSGDRADTIARTLRDELIPRLARAHREALSQIRPEDVVSFTDELLRGDEAVLVARLANLHRLGFTPQALCMELLAPAARRLGRLWDDDRCDFTAVTIGTGQLQRLLRTLAAGQWPGDERPGAGLRILLAQAPHEQHSLGLSMVSQFFEAAGWAVTGGVGEALAAPAEVLRAQPFDVVGFSVGGETALGWLREQIAAARAHSLNPALVVMVGGPLFNVHPEWVSEVGADLCPVQVHEAPVLAATRVREAMARQHVG